MMKNKKKFSILNKIKLWFARKKANASLKPLKKAKKIRERNKVLAAYGETIKIITDSVRRIVICTITFSLAVIFLYVLFTHLHSLGLTDLGNLLKQFL